MNERKVYWNIKWTLDLRDVWVGVYWNRTESGSDVDETTTFQVYICLLPLLPLRISRTVIEYV